MRYIGEQTCEATVEATHPTEELRYAAENLMDANQRLHDAKREHENAKFRWVAVRDTVTEYIRQSESIGTAIEEFDAPR